MRRTRSPLLPLALFASACFADPNADESCEPGSQDCACFEDQTCLEGLACEGGQCVLPSATSTGGGEGSDGDPGTGSTTLDDSATSDATTVSDSMDDSTTEADASTGDESSSTGEPTGPCAELPAAGCTPAATIDVGLEHVCAIAGERIRCWGANTFGSVGTAVVDAVYGDDEAPAAAPDIFVGGVPVALAAGDRHTCALLEGGDVQCWGHNVFGSVGVPGSEQLVGDDESPGSVGPVDLGFPAVQISAAAFQTCARGEAGQVLCWGRGENGILGHGDQEDIGDDETPASVGPVDLGGEAAVDVAAGRDHVCVLLASGPVRCWGRNDTGQLGLGNIDDYSAVVPADIPNIQLAGEDPVHVAASQGGGAVLRADGSVTTWGGYATINGYGSDTGIGPSTSPEDAIVDVGESLLSLPVRGNLRHFCGVSVGGAVRCWGVNERGQLGLGHDQNVGDDESPVSAGPTDLGDDTVVEVAVGFNNTCARFDDDSIKCWGAGEFGVVGQATTDDYGDDPGETPATQPPIDYD